MVIKSKVDKVQEFYDAIKEHKRKSLMCFLLAYHAKAALGKKAEAVKLVPVKKENDLWYYKIANQIKEKPKVISEDEYKVYFYLAKEYVDGMC